jgi:ribosomal protein S18 acetylase RimI-like enzyme
MIWPFWLKIAIAGETISWDPTTSNERARDAWMDAAAQVFVVVDGSDIVASAQMRPNYGPASRIANATYIVDPARANAGVGRRLVVHTVDVARAQWFRAMVFNAVVETNHAAVHLYESLGFTILATVPEAFEHPTMGPVGAHIMYLKL